MIDYLCALAGNHAADDHHPRLRTEGSRGHSFFNTGHGDPPGSGPYHRRSAKCKRMAVGIGFEDSHEFGVARGKALEKAIVVFKGAGAYLNPARARLHANFLKPVYGMCAGTLALEALANEREGNKGFAFRRDLVDELLLEIMRFDAAATLSDIALPTLIVVGTRDVMTPVRHARALVSSIPSAELVELPGCGHMPMLERRAEFNDLLRELLER